MFDTVRLLWQLFYYKYTGPSSITYNHLDQSTVAALYM